NTRAYQYFLAGARYVICDSTLPRHFIRREGQKYLNPWHGIAFKTVGRANHAAKFGAVKTTRNLLQATHMVSACPDMTTSLINSYSLTGTATAGIAEVGYPRVDLTLAARADGEN